MSDETAAAGVADALERLRLAEAKLARRRQAVSGLTDTDRTAMRYILEAADAGREVTPSRLATRMHMSPASATVLVDRLVEAGLVQVSPHPTDRRKKLVVPADRDLDPDHIDPLTRRIRTLAATLPAAEAAIIAAFLEEVIGVVGATRA